MLLRAACRLLAIHLNYITQYNNTEPNYIVIFLVIAEHSQIAFNKLPCRMFVLGGEEYIQELIITVHLVIAKKFFICL